MKSKQVAHVGPNFQLIGGAHGLRQSYVHTAPNLALAGGTHTTTHTPAGVAVDAAGDEVGEVYTATNSEAGRYPAASDTLSEGGRYVTGLGGGGGPTPYTVPTPQPTFSSSGEPTPSARAAFTLRRTSN